jgi:hypothetical protein
VERLEPFLNGAKPTAEVAILSALPSPPYHAVSTARGPVVADLRAWRRCPDGRENNRTGISRAWGPAARLRRGGRHARLALPPVAAHAVIILE